ncbi:MAG: SigE family RNA polymerase sigma factor [Mycobacteriales bacterium]
MKDDTADITQFVTAVGPRLVRFGFLLTGDLGSAEDLVQFALLETCRRWGRLRHDSSPEAYVRRCMINRQASLWRRRSSRDVLVGDVPEHPLSEDLAGRVAEIDRLSRALRSLPTGQRAAVVLRFYEDLPEAEVAAILGCSLGNVKSQTSRGLDKLRAALTSPAHCPEGA